MRILLLKFRRQQFSECGCGVLDTRYYSNNLVTADYSIFNAEFKPKDEARTLEKVPVENKVDLHCLETPHELDISAQERVSRIYAGVDALAFVTRDRQKRVKLAV
jgi:hypothetical protein